MPQHDIQPVDMHAAIEKVRQLKGTKPDGNWLSNLLDQLPWLKKTLLDLGQTLNDFFKSLFNHLNNAFPKLDQVPGLSAQASKIIYIGVTALLCFLGIIAIYIALRWYRRRMEMRQLSRPAQALNKTFDDTLLINASHHWQEAQTLATRLDYSEATRQVYFAALCSLDETHTLPFDESRSNRECEIQLSEASQSISPQASLETSQPGLPKNPLVEYFASLARQFERIRYGKLEAGAAEFSTTADEYRAFSKLLSAHAPKQPTRASASSASARPSGGNPS